MLARWPTCRVAGSSSSQVSNLRSASTRASSRGRPKKASKSMAKQPAYMENDASFANLRRYQSHWLQLLNMEYDEEQRVVLERLRTWPLSRLEREGLTLSELTNPVRAGSSFSRDLVRLHAPTLPQRQHSFEVGDEAILSLDGPLDSSGHLHRNAVQC